MHSGACSGQEVRSLVVAVIDGGLVGLLVALLVGLAIALVGLLVLLALVLHISNVARVAINLVLNTLGPAVREEDVVGAIGVVAIPVLLLAEVEGTAVCLVVLNAIGVLVLGVAVLILELMVRRLVILGLRFVVAGAMAVAGATMVGKGNGSERKEDEDLKTRDRSE